MISEKEKRRAERKAKIISSKPLQDVLSPLERVKGDNTPLNEETLLQDLLPYIDAWCDKYGIDDLVKAPQRQFNALCYDIGRKAHKNKIYKALDKIDNGSVMPSTCDRYNIDSICEGIAVYEFLCNRYNKAFLIHGVADFLGVNKDSLYNWADVLSARGIRLNEKQEDSLTRSAVDVKTTNITGVLATLNHFHGWNKETRVTKEKETIVIYPSLGTSQQSQPQLQTNQVL